MAAGERGGALLVEVLVDAIDDLTRHEVELEIILLNELELRLSEETRRLLG